jgi:copper transport protein
VELALFCVVIGVTAVLVTEPPAKASVAASGPVARTAQVGPYELNAVVDPAVRGENDIHLYLLDKTGQPAKVAETTVAATLPDPGIGPLKLETHPAGPGHFSVLGAELSLAGDWELEVSVRRGEFDLWQATILVPIRKE